MTEPLAPGIYPDLPMRDYLSMPALSASALGWLKKSPLNYRYCLTNRPKDTDATFLGTVAHKAILEPAAFDLEYMTEPEELYEDLGISLNASPRATKAYREWSATQATSGRKVLQDDTAALVRGMAEAVRAHPWARKVLGKAPEREVTLVWDRDGRRCRARSDAMGPGLIVNLKTTRRLRDFSPWEVTRLGYYRGAGWNVDGAERLGRKAGLFVFIAVENEPPFDVGVFEAPADFIRAGQIECEGLLDLLHLCERENHWPGMYEQLQKAAITDALAADMAGMDDGVEIAEEIA